MALCNYPLHVVRLSSTAARLLHLCTAQHNCQELAQQLGLLTRHVETLCEQLRWKGLLEAGPALPPASWPSVSIIVPSHNRASSLKRCLHSLFNLDYPAQRLEILVVDDASSDETSVLLQEFAQEFATCGKPLRVIHHHYRQGVAISRNSGAEIAHHELLAYIDSDCVASAGWLTELVPVFQNAAVGAVGGMLRAYERQSMLGRYEDVRSSLFMGIRPQRVRREGPLTYLPTANLLVRRELWQKLGGFAPLPFGEDVDFCRRLLSAGFHILYLPQGVVYHDYRTDLWAFLNTRVCYASSEATLLQRYPSERRVLVLPPEQAIFAGIVLSGVWSLMRGSTKGMMGGTRTVLAFVLAILLILFGAYNRMKKVQQQHIPIAPFTIFQATLRSHLAYTYHLCRHLTRYYTFPVLLVGLLLPPLLLLGLITQGIVIGVDYARLRPQLSVGRYALCSLLDDCAYEVGVLIGCIKQKTWKPLLPILKKENPAR